MKWLILLLMTLALGSCSFHAIKEQVDKIIYRAPNVEIKTAPTSSDCPMQSPDISKKILGKRIITYDKDGHIINVEPLKE